jgi:endonuclease/exonuclease/phosphatase family metal-dependent hydrolase
MLRKMSVLLLAALLSSANADPAGATRPPSIAGPGHAYEKSLKVARVQTAAEITVMSFNVCGGVCHHGEVTKTAGYTAQTAVARQASVVLLQELCYGQFLRVQSLLAKHGYSGTFTAATRSGGCATDDPGKHTSFGVAVLVKGKNSGRVVTILPTPAGIEERRMLRVTAVVGGRSTFVAVVHLSPSPAGATPAQLAAVAHDLNPPAATRPVIVGGDFNALPGNPGLGALYSAATEGTGQFFEADELRTGVARRGGAPTFDTVSRKIDYVFFSAGFFAQPSALSLASQVSDHRVYLGLATTR